MYLAAATLDVPYKLFIQQSDTFEPFCFMPNEQEARGTSSNNNKNKLKRGGDMAANDSPYSSDDVRNKFLHLDLKRFSE